MERDRHDIYWDRERETRDPSERRERSLTRLQDQLRRCYENIPFYRRHWEANDFHPEAVKSWEDFTQGAPVITKKMLVADQAEHPPFGSYLGVPEEDVFRIHGSSGTTGTPTMYGVDRNDWDRAGEAFAATQWAMGVRPEMVVQFAFPFSLFFGGWGTLYGAERVGASCFPLGLADTNRHIELMWKLGSQVIEATPTYLLHMAEVAKNIGYDPSDSPIRHAIVGGEPGGSIPATRERILEAWQLDTVCDSGSTSEMFPFCTNTECTEMRGPHLWQDEVWTEIVDPEDHTRALEDGERGAIVYTHLWRTSQPMIRFAPGDAGVMTSEPCPCGRTYPRLEGGVLGRLDDMLVIRGANVYPSAIEAAVRGVEGLGNEFRIIVEREGEMDEISVQVEVENTDVDRDWIAQEASRRIRENVHIRVPVELVEPGSFERSTLKAKRVIDRRQ